MTAADEFCRASPIYDAALRYGARSGPAFEVSPAPRMRWAPIVLACAFGAGVWAVIIKAVFF